MLKEALTSFINLCRWFARSHTTDIAITLRMEYLTPSDNIAVHVWHFTLAANNFNLIGRL